jgi:hypothetical protein
MNRATRRSRVALLLAAVALGASSSAAISSPVDWDAIAQCESGGNWAADTGNGYYGGLQISAATWRANGGVGSPAAASPQEQIAVANRIMATQGPAAWPKCSMSTGTATAGSIPNILTQLEKTLPRHPCWIPLQCY